jgi:hypothetical protein
MTRSSKTKATRGGGDGMMFYTSNWIADYAKEPKASKERQSLLTDEASTIAHDTKFMTFILTCIRIFIALFPITMLELMVFGAAPNGVINDPVIYAIMIYAFDMSIGVIAGLPTAPNLYLSVLAPVWAFYRGRPGKTWGLTWRTFILNVFYAGWELLVVFFAQLAVSNIFASSFVLTIPSRPATVTSVVYGTVLALCTAAQVSVAWFDVLGVGDLDGAWLPRSPAKNNWKREQWDRSRSAVIQSMSFLFVNIVVGVPMIVNPLYIFATWTQHTNSATNDYGLILTWTVATAAMLVVGFMLVHLVFTDKINDILQGITFGEGHSRWRRYGRQHHNRDYEDEDDGGEDEDETEESEV